MGLLDGKVALVTGAARGIGKAIALRFASEGADIAFTDLAIDENGQKTIDEIAAFGHKVKGYASNAADFEQTHEVVNQILAEFGHIDILVNNAGLTRDNLLIRMSEEEWDAVLATNLKGAFLFSKAVARPMMKQRSGAIVNISSVVGLIGNPGQCNYAASKAGLIALTQSMAKELASRNIRVNAVAPGFIVSQMTDALPDDLKSAMLAQIPAGRFGEVADIAKAVAFLAGPDASYITGQTLSVNGGLVM